VAGATKNRDRAWVTQQARNVSGELVGEGIAPRFLIRDCDAKFARPRHGVRGRRSQDEYHPDPGTRRGRLRGTVGGYGAFRVPGLDAGVGPTTPGAGLGRVRRALRRPSTPPNHRVAVPAGKRDGEQFPNNVETGSRADRSSVDSSTSTGSLRDGAPSSYLTVRSRSGILASP